MPPPPPPPPANFRLHQSNSPHSHLSDLPPIGMAPDPLLLDLQRGFCLIALQDRTFGGKFIFSDDHCGFRSLKTRVWFLGSCFGMNSCELLATCFLLEAALNCAYKTRVYVFNRVLGRDMDFFEGGNGILPGDNAYRITAEASDVSDTVYSLQNVMIARFKHES